MRRIFLGLTMAALIAAVMAASAVPAMALDVDFDNDFGFFGFDGGFGGTDFDQESESGDVDLSFESSNTGDNSNVCAPASQFANTGNVQNAQGFSSFGSGFDGDGFFDNDDFDLFDFDGGFDGDVEFEGSEFEFVPDLETTCDQAVQQSSAASSN